MDMPRFAVSDVHQSHDDIAKGRQRLIDTTSLLHEEYAVDRTEERLKVKDILPCLF